ncbi:hypothetical protein ACOSP7_032922 [Xanthoceras sorbifolium]|uniref:Uncharacterized protein n=1 Tax=Xanthoceras sorbifolium TaxID=99658 RepID=A0ABQ8H3E1_9ROSI|nr:hypothetical protein JRO89_XS14G0022700 [Xanthoceras sorbifolium]
MEVECSVLNWGNCHPEEGLMEEMRHSLLYTTLELETTIVSAKEEIARREFELIHVKDVLNRTVKERNEAQTKCQKLMLENLLLQQQLQKQEQEQKQKQKQKQEAALPSRSASSSEDESKSVGDSNKHFSSSDSTKNFAALSPLLSDPIILQVQLPLPEALPEAALDKLAAEKPLPEKGKLLKAVMEAGPLLQTLLLAGPLPQWQHPPPQLDTFEIPPVAISSPSPRLLHQDSFNNSNSTLKKRGLVELNEASDSSPNTKYQKVVLH